MKAYPAIKRIGDLTLSFIAVLILWPVFLLLAVLIKADSKGPVLFRQRRIGKNKKEFLILKFRTMRAETPDDIPTHKLHDPEACITKIGWFLRKSSLDELPQLFNIIKGNMSIIGPRPALWNQSDLIRERDKYGANDIRPGLTGLAQINGRDGITIEAKARLDGDYANNVRFVTDIKCLAATIISVLKSEGVIEGERVSEKMGLERQ